ncbi:MAG: methionyl-tRNA formyltransferase [Coprobacillus sp.]|nr:methionyl-tRNA formyltransferase [Coprobacillus sp.]
MKHSSKKILYFGTPKVSAGLLEALIKEGFNIIGLVTSLDKEVGRNKEKEIVPTKEVALRYNIPVYQVAKLKDDYSFIEDLKPDIILTFSFGQIIPQVVLDIPKVGCLNVHGSLLPKYRGASPIQAALINREKVTGVSLMEMTKKMDAGKVYATKEIAIEENENSTTLFKKLENAAIELTIDKLDDYLEGRLIGQEQNEEEATFCYTIKPEEEKLNLELDKEHLIGWIYALSDNPGGYLYLDNKKLKIFEAKVVSSETNYQVGTIIQASKQGLYLQVSDGVLSLLSLQLEGKKRVDYLSFINGHQDLEGKVLH